MRAGLAESDRQEELGWIAAAQTGDRASMGRLYERYARSVHAILLSRVKASEAEDLVQEVFVQAMRSLPSLADAAAFPGWLAQIARNKAVDHYRRKRPTEELPEHIPGGASTSLDALAILTVVRGLPDTYRETLLMRLVEGMSGPEIAARTGMTHDSVRVNLYRGMKLLREKLA